MNCPKCGKPLKEESFGVHCINKKCKLYGKVAPGADQLVAPKPSPASSANAPLDKRVETLESRLDAIQGVLHDQPGGDSAATTDRIAAIEQALNALSAQVAALVGDKKPDKTKDK